MEYTEEQFRDLVALESKGEADESFSLMLREDDNLLRWRETLVSLKCQLEQQFSVKKAEVMRVREATFYTDKKTFYGSQIEYEQWKGSVHMFLRSIMERMTEVKRLMRVAGKRRHKNERLTYVKGLRAIIKRAGELIPLDNGWHDELEALNRRSMDDGDYIAAGVDNADNH